MGISVFNASNDMMVKMMQTLMQGMQQSAELATDMVAVNIENAASGQKMAIAQHIIDVYA